MKYIKFITVSCLSLLFTIYTTISCANTNTISAPYTDSSYLTNVPFGSHSHWLQPWRAYLETVPATAFLDGVGLVWNQKNGRNPELFAKMLSKNGIHQVRFQINWSTLDYDDETKLKATRETEYKQRLVALKKYGIRPLILLNAHHGTPCPFKSSKYTLANDASAGDVKVHLENTEGLKVNYSGISNLSKYWAAEAIITDISDNTIILSKPLPEDIKAGKSVRIATLKYRPFSVPGSKDYEETMEGWKRYVGNVAKFTTEVLGTTQSSDKGFDLEIWNELTFGSNFLYINRYYANEPYDYKEKSIWSNLVQETADYVEANSANFQGVKITNGFSNTIPWPASSEQPKRINGISKHPYRKRNYYPEDENKHTKPLNMIGKRSNFVPSYSTLFPEYQATALRSATIIRDMGPITSKINGKEHGRYARGIDDEVRVWITETNINPTWIESEITEERAIKLKAKTTSRYFCFYLNKGAKRVYLYGMSGGDKGWGIIKQSFINYAKDNTAYPANDSEYTSSALETLSNIVTKMSNEIDRNLIDTRPLEIESIKDWHNNYQFLGNGDEAHPNLYDREVFTFLPFQVNSQKFVIPYYVMTRDIGKAVTPEDFTVTIKGVQGTNALVTGYDPINDIDIPVTVKKRTKSSLSLKLSTTDYPYLLTIQEDG
ncbi:MAG: hypothetical protein QNJ32_05220 [Xenococcaceae cyanobacterium MO_167.B27]|nr:hypothetical protein [Xenococcaceae cyanobacterium MO_167.B27]